jgi:hypothetical protein
MSLYDDPFVQRLLNGTDNPVPGVDANGTPFDPNQINSEDQQRIASPIPPATPLVSPLDAVQPPTGATELQPNTGQPTQYAFQQPQTPRITSILDLIRERGSNTLFSPEYHRVGFPHTKSIEGYGYLRPNNRSRAVIRYG